MPDRSALVIDDDVAIGALVTHLLQRANVLVAIAENGAQAFDLVRRQSFRVILLDLMMPEMNGFDFLDALRDERPDLVSRVIVVTAHSKRGQPPVCDDVFQVLNKPFDIVELLQAVELCLSDSVHTNIALNL